MKLMRITRPTPALVLLVSCSELSTELPETTTIQIVSPNAGAIRSADGLFEVEFQLGALSDSAEVYVRTDRTRRTNDWRLSETLPQYEVRISPCTITRPDLVKIRHRVTEGLAWNGRLTLARTLGDLTESPLPTTFEGEWVEARAILECTSGPDPQGMARFELATFAQPDCAPPPDAVCGPCEPCRSTDQGCAQTEDWICERATCIPISEAEEPSCTEVQIEGWNHNPASGRAFIVDHFEVAGRGRGLDVDGVCRGPGDCIENSLWWLGELDDTAIRENLLRGDFRLLIELAGLEEAYSGDDPTLTIKTYRARDADDPAFPANDFQIPAGETTCCEFSLSPISLSGSPPQARSRAPARVQAGVLSSLAPIELPLALVEGPPPHPEFPTARGLLSARLPVTLDGIESGLLGGVVPISVLAQTDNPYCKTLNQLCPRQLPQSTLIDLVASFGQPDIDLDVPRDGLERIDVGADGRVNRCIDGNGALVPPLDEDAPWTCTLDPRMADGYSIAFEFTAVPATIVGLAD